MIAFDGVWKELFVDMSQMRITKIWYCYIKLKFDSMPLAGSDFRWMIDWMYEMATAEEKLKENHIKLSEMLFSVFA